MRKNSIFDDELDEEVNAQIEMNFSDKKQCEIMQRVAFTNGLLNHLQHFAKSKIHSNNNVQDFNTDHDQQISYPVKTATYNETMAQNILKISFDELDNKDEHDVNVRNSMAHEKNESLEQKINQFITSKQLS
jgi:hypothetical protein